jgi:hypothetical protein
MINKFLKKTSAGALMLAAATIVVTTTSTSAFPVAAVTPFNLDELLIEELVYDPSETVEVETVNWRDRGSRVLRWGARTAKRTLPGRIAVGLATPRRACAPSSQTDIDNC